MKSYQTLQVNRLVEFINSKDLYEIAKLIVPYHVDIADDQSTDIDYALTRRKHSQLEVVRLFRLQSAERLFRRARKALASTLAHVEIQMQLHGTRRCVRDATLEHEWRCNLTNAFSFQNC